MHKKLPRIPMLITAVEIRMPPDMPVQTKKRTAAIFLAFVKEKPSRARNGTARSRIRYQIYSSALILTVWYWLKK